MKPWTLHIPIRQISVIGTTIRSNPRMIDTFSDTGRKHYVEPRREEEIPEFPHTAPDSLTFLRGVL
jgi:hypothetical protein